VDVVRWRLAPSRRDDGTRATAFSRA
jgi:hypothetical protein